MMTELRRLVLRRCTGLRSLPSGFRRFSKRNRRGTCAPRAFGDASDAPPLPSLQFLDLTGCSGLVDFPKTMITN